MNFRPLLVAAALLAPATARAHELWFLPDPPAGAERTRLYFGDSPAPGEAERVAEIAHARVWVDGRPVAVRRLDDGLEVPAPPGAAAVATAFADRGVIDHEGRSFVITLAAYAQSRPLAAGALPDLGVGDDQLRLLWVARPDGSTTLRATRQGQPAAGALVRIFRGTAESTEARTDGRGELAVPDLTRGGVSCLATVETPTPGKRDDRAYEFIRYKATLTLYPAPAR